MNDTLFTIGPTQTLCAAPAAEARAAFVRSGALLSRPGIDAGLLGGLQRAAASAGFVSDPVVDLGHRWIERPHKVGAAVEVALARRPLLDWLEAVTGCGAITHLEGRLVQTRAGGEDGLVWHADTADRMVLGLTLHLFDCAYEGGEFDIRDARSKLPTFHHAQARGGDVVVFDIDTRFEHRVAPVLSGQPRTVFTGWFVNGR